MQAIPPERFVFEEEVPGGAIWSHVLGRHRVLRVTDVAGGANVSLLLYNRDQLLERYNMPDTLKAQHTAYLTKGRALYSDMGRILCSMIEDSCGWHDTIAGMSDATLVREKYGPKSYQEQRNARHRNARDEFLVELGKWGLDARDLVPNVNLFSKVVANDAGQLRYVAGHSQAGACVELRAEMNVLCVLSTCQHPLDPGAAYAPKPVRLQVYRGDAPGPDDACRTSRPENARGFINTEHWFRAQIPGDRA